MSILMKSHSIWTTFALAALSLSSLTGCSSEEAQPIIPDSGQMKKDSVVWPDKGTSDSERPAEDAGASDSRVEPDAETCDHVKATCANACSAQEICTGASGGTCVELVSLAGDPTDQTLILEFLKALIPCWQPGADDTLCATVDSCLMTGDLTDKIVRDWVCNEAESKDFPSEDDYNMSQLIFGCGTLTNIDWKVAAIHPGEAGRICLVYQTSWSNEIFIDDCKNFPY